MSTKNPGAGRQNTTTRTAPKTASKSAAKKAKPKSDSGSRRAGSQRVARKNITSGNIKQSQTTDSETADTGRDSGATGLQMPEFPEFADVGEFIRQQREKMEMSVRRLSELAGVSNPYLSQIERGLRNPSADILQQVANALRISVETLYVRAGILPDHERSVSTVPEAIENDNELTADQKVALLNVYQSFVSPR